MPFTIILNNPVIMEIGRVGFVQDTSLLMGFLLMRLAEEIERNPRKLTSPHVTVVEEAHRLMAEVGLGGGNSRSSAGEDLPMFAEVRGFGEGTHYCRANAHHVGQRRHWEYISEDHALAGRCAQF